MLLLAPNYLTFFLRDMIDLFLTEFRSTSNFNSLNSCNHFLNRLRTLEKPVASQAPVAGVAKGSVAPLALPQQIVPRENRMAR